MLTLETYNLMKSDDVWRVLIATSVAFIVENVTCSITIKNNSKMYLIFLIFVSSSLKDKISLI